ncbi:MAG: hypothetical protein A3J57_01235 [Candidatus Wildermuthbacteria bacterium RIFCSPHIGHO2_02_FULL_49_12b]|nr:MAG: hypothetical protein A3J57_01235 [Candidatus Wildermuthbacteria bacterium RIFCSPHIGHO2_02_FULL_49_12b]
MAEALALEQSAKQPPQASPAEQETPTATASFLDPDVMLVMAVAVSIDILDFTLAFGVIENIILGIPIMLWMVWKRGRPWAAAEQVQRIRQAPELRQKFVQEQQQKLIARRMATRRAWRRGILYFLGGLVPILSIFVLWTWAVISTVRGK